MTSPITKHYRVKGRVQGVSFRAFARQQARLLGIGGWVRNCEDGSVEACATAEPDTLDKFEKCLRAGPSLARVDTLGVETTELQEFRGFEISA